MENPKVEALLARLFEGRERDLCSYALNVALHCRPWWPPLPLVWQYREAELPPTMTHEKKDEHWQAALALLTELHKQYRETHPPRTLRRD